MLWTRKVHLGVPTRTRAYWDRARIRAVRAVATVLARGVPLSFLSSCLGQSVIGFLGCWRLVEGAVTQHGIEGIKASSSQSNNGLFMSFLLGTFLVVVAARGRGLGLP